MRKILVVDDDPGMLAAIRRLLENAGFEVIEASDGQDAITRLRDEDIDLTIVDVFMPNVDGMEFTIRVKQWFPDAKIIVMTGGGLIDKTNVLQIARSVGATATIAKPFEMVELLGAVREVLKLPDPTADPSPESVAGNE